MRSVFARHTGEVIGVAVVVVLFLGMGYASERYFTALTEFISQTGIWGMVVYVVGAVIATVVAPLSFLPILPVAVNLWGSFLAAILSIIAWSIGAAIAFLIARRFGRPIVRYFVGAEKMDKFSHVLPKRYLFLAVVFLRIVVPVDLLSYAIGLMGIMRFWSYMLATVIGITPFAFVFSYVATLSTLHQIVALGVGAICILLVSPYLKRRYREVFQDSEILQ